jgi:hypothetical protein
MALVQTQDFLAAAAKGGYTVTPRKGYTVVAGPNGTVCTVAGAASGPLAKVDCVGQATDLHMVAAAKAGARAAKPGVLAASGTTAQAVAKALLPRLAAGKVSRTSAAAAKAAAAAAAAKAAKAKAKPAKAAPAAPAAAAPAA